ncbi:hypothetical protein M3B46_04205 [Sphingobacterium daejeonense]|nr:hypothetical protein [Sphingobacterium daejeonense]MCT1530181.1 hypothetical protein [Sphingobacterium daejeonense]
MKTSTIFGQLTIEDISTSSAEVFRANRSVRPDGERGRKITVTSSRRLSELLRKHGRSGSFLKTLLDCSPFSNPIVFLKWRSKRLSFFVRTVSSLQQVPLSDSSDGLSEASFQKSDQQDMYFRHLKTAHQQMLQNKDSFFEHSESDNINFDSILATVIVKDFQEGLSETLLYKRTKSYLLKSEDLFRALDRIGLNEDIVILNFGVNLEYLSSSLKTKEFSNGKYRNVDIYQFERSHRVSDSLFILRKSDLPNITTMDIDQETITKYSLSRISNHIKLFLSLIDLNQTSAEVYNENKMNRTDDELRKSVLISIFITLQIKWKKSIELIQFEEYSDYFQTGIINKLEDVKPIPTYIE